MNARPLPVSNAPGLATAALARRRPLATADDTDTYRLFHRQADGLPELAVDRFGATLVAHVYGPALQPDARAVVSELKLQTRSQAVYLKRRPTQASALSPAQRAELAPEQPLVGEATPEVVVRENGLAYEIRPGAGLSVGLFPDMREMRALIRREARGRRVLNTFAYTCGFGVAALAGGAARVVNIDASKAHLAWGQRNYALNSLGADPHDFIFGDVFDWLARFARRGERFDWVILDPPPYATTKRTRFSIQRDYGPLAALALDCLAPDGRLLACANAAELDERDFARHLISAGAQVRARHHEPALDFPPGSGRPYLKLAVCER